MKLTPRSLWLCWGPRERGPRGCRKHRCHRRRAPLTINSLPRRGSQLPPSKTRRDGDDKGGARLASRPSWQGMPFSRAIKLQSRPRPTQPLTPGLGQWGGGRGGQEWELQCSERSLGQALLLIHRSDSGRLQTPSAGSWDRGGAWQSPPGLAGPVVSRLGLQGLVSWRQDNSSPASPCPTRGSVLV